VFEDVSKHLPKGLFFRIVVTGLIANILVTLALAPFVAYHFNQFNPYWALGNLLISVLFSFFIMPLLFISAILMPFHWEGPVLKCVGFMLDQVTFLAGKVAAWSGSEIIVPSFSCWGLGVIAIGIVLLCVMKTRWRFCGFGFILLGCVLGFCLGQHPDIVVFKQGRTILVRQEGKFIAIKGNVEDWLVQRFIRQQGQNEIDTHKVKMVRVGNAKVALDAKHCKNADLAILAKENTTCRAKTVFVPQDYSSYKIFLKDPIEIYEEARDNDRRPWGLKFKRKENK